MLSIITKSKLEPVLLEPHGEGLEEVYYTIRGRPNITVLFPGMMGKEFAKTFGHYHKHNEPEKYEILLGVGKFIIQAREINDWEKDILVIDVKKGDTISIPFGFGHCMINTGEAPMVTIDTAPSNAVEEINEYEPIKNKHGMGFYITRENEELKLIKNSAYER